MFLIPTGKMEQKASVGGSSSTNSKQTSISSTSSAVKGTTGPTLTRIGTSLRPKYGGHRSNTTVSERTHSPSDASGISSPSLRGFEITKQQ